jgi:hypothetical protein
MLSSANRRRSEDAIIDSFNDDLDCLITGIHFYSDLSVFEIYFVPTTIAVADDGVGHVSNSPRHVMVRILE